MPLKGEVRQRLPSERQPIVVTMAGVVTEPWGTWSTQSVRVSIVLTSLTRGVEYHFRVRERGGGFCRQQHGRRGPP